MKEKLIQRNLLLGIIVTNIADSIFYIMTIWYFNEVYSSSILLAFVFSIVSLIDAFSFLFGPLIDRTTSKINLLCTSIFQTTCVMLLFFITMGSREESAFKSGALVVLLVLTYLASSIIYPSSEKIIPLIADEKKLLQVNSLFKTSEKILDIFFNAVSTVMIAFFDMNILILAILILFLVSIKFYYVVSKNVNDKGFKGEEEDYSVQEYVSDLQQGILEIKNHKEISILFIPLIFVNFFYGVAIVVLPIVSKLYICEEAYGYGSLLMCSSLGGVFGAYVISKFSKALEKTTFYTSLFLLLAGVSWLGMTLSLQKNVVASYIFIFLSNCAINMMNIVFVALIQKNIENTLLGRVSTLTESMVSIMIPIGNFFGGILVNHISPLFVELMYGVALIFCSMPYLLKRE